MKRGNGGGEGEWEKKEWGEREGGRGDERGTLAYNSTHENISHREANHPSTLFYQNNLSSSPYKPSFNWSCMSMLQLHVSLCLV